MSSTTISEKQRRLNQELHQNRADFGSTGGAGNQDVIKAIKRYNKLAIINSVLDYGTGKGQFPKSLQKALPNLEVKAYDPAVEHFSARPDGTFDMVTCFDVLEHVERDSVSAVLEEIRSYSAKVVFLQIDLQPAIKRLQDGRNAHIMLAPPDWWLAQCSPHFPVIGTFPVFHESGVLQKINIVGSRDCTHGPLVWSLLAKMQSSGIQVQSGYLSSPDLYDTNKFKVLEIKGKKK